jgi:hypothetical protein
MVNARKAQAALEFLTTYGWAILVLVVVLIALGWLGIFNVQNQVQDRCTFPIGTIDCLDVRVNWWNPGTANAFAGLGGNVVLKNNFDKKITVCDFACSARDVDPNTGWPLGYQAMSTGCYSFRSVQPGEVKPVDIGGLTQCVDAAGRTDSAGVGERYVGKLYVAYKVEGESNIRIISGDLVSTVEPGN